MLYFFCMQGSSSWWTATTGRGWTRRGRNCPECLLRTNSETPCCSFLQINRWVWISDTRRAKKRNEPQIYFSIGLDEKAFRYKDQDFICTGPFFNLKKGVCWFRGRNASIKMVWTSTLNVSLLGIYMLWNRTGERVASRVNVGRQKYQAAILWETKSINWCILLLTWRLLVWGPILESWQK